MTVGDHSKQYAVDKFFLTGNDLGHLGAYQLQRRTDGAQFILKLLNILLFHRNAILLFFTNGKFLDGNYAAFGKVVSGIEVVDEIAGVKTNFQDRPVIDMRMKKVTLIEE